MNKFPELSIFFPFWNEGKNVEQVVSKAITIAQKIADKWEIIMVDDGSSDNTAEIAKKLEAKHLNLRLVSHQPNRGYGAALKEGFESARYKYIVFNDGDGQFDFAQVEKFLGKIEDVDIVIGHRKVRVDN